MNFRSVAPVAKEDILPLMEVILRLNGIGIVEEGGLYRIIPISDLSKEPAPVGVGRESESVKVTGKALLQVVPVNYVQSSDMVRILSPFLSTNAVIVDVPKSNHIIIVDTDANVRRLLQLVEIFDTEQAKRTKPKVFVYPVQNSKAKDVASLLQQIFLGVKSSTPSTATKTTTQTKATVLPSSQPQPSPVQPQPQVSMGASGSDTLVSDITKIFPDEVTNTIIILATPEDYVLIAEAIKKIDIVPRQVMIEAIIAEVTLTDKLSFGLAWSLKTDISIKGMKPFNRDINLRGDIGYNSGSLSGLDVTALSGFTFLASDAGGVVKALLETLVSEDKARVLSSPHILVSDNREARIQIGDQVPIATSETSVSGTTDIQRTIQYKDTGTILKVKPQVNDSGLVALDITQEVSNFRLEKIFGSDQVVISKREAVTSLVAQSGQTIVIGGLISEDASNSRSGLPILSDIPILGYLFGNTTKSTVKKELIILLTPYVIRSQFEAETVSSEYINRLKQIDKEMKIKKDGILKDKKKDLQRDENSK